jgi:hypothetical protein
MDMNENGYGSKGYDMFSNREPFKFTDKEPFKFSDIETDDFLLSSQPEYNPNEEDWLDREVRIFWRNKMIDEVLKGDD